MAATPSVPSRSSATSSASFSPRSRPTCAAPATFSTTTRPHPRLSHPCAATLALHLVGRSYDAIADELGLGWGPLAHVATARAERALSVKAGALYALDPLELERRRAEDARFDTLPDAYSWPDGYLDNVLVSSDDDTPADAHGGASS